MSLLICPFLNLNPLPQQSRSDSCTWKYCVNEVQNCVCVCVCGQYFLFLSESHQLLYTVVSQICFAHDTEYNMDCSDSSVVLEIFIVSLLISCLHTICCQIKIWDTFKLIMFCAKCFYGIVYRATKYTTRKLLKQIFHIIF